MYAERRARFLEAIGPGVAVLPAAPVHIRNNDVEFPYRQQSDFYYLTGLDEPGSVLVLSNAHEQHRAVLFVRERDPERETWDGPRVGVEAAPERYGVDAAFAIDALDQELPAYLRDVRRLHYRLGRDPRFDARVLAILEGLRARQRHGIGCPSEIVDPGVVLHEMRLRKSEDELARVRRAIEITGEAHVAAMRVARPGAHEFEVEAELTRVFRARGAERAAYECIVGSGPNATILHYRKNDRRMEEGDLLLIDAGCEHGYYASDVTRTFPVGGRFTAEQRAVYDVVLAAQEAAVAAVRPGVTIDDVHDAAVRSLVDGIVEIGLMPGTADELLESGDYKKLYMHRTSHWLGMDVHDVGAYFVDGAARPMEPGFLLTVEPGIYVARDADVDERFRGIGVRIEDDVLVTEDGRENLSAAIPRDPAELERILADR